MCKHVCVWYFKQILQFFVLNFKLTDTLLASCNSHVVCDSLHCKWLRNFRSRETEKATKPKKEKEILIKTVWTQFFSTIFLRWHFIFQLTYVSGTKDQCSRANNCIPMVSNRCHVGNQAIPNNHYNYVQPNRCDSDTRRVPHNNHVCCGNPGDKWLQNLFKN